MSTTATALALFLVLSVPALLAGWGVTRVLRATGLIQEDSDVPMQVLAVHLGVMLLAGLALTVVSRHDREARAESAATEERLARLVVAYEQGDVHVERWWPMPTCSHANPQRTKEDAAAVHRAIHRQTVDEPPLGAAEPYMRALEEYLRLCTNPAAMSTRFRWLDDRSLSDAGRPTYGELLVELEGDVEAEYARYVEGRDRLVATLSSR